jgi:integrase
MPQAPTRARGGHYRKSHVVRHGQGWKYRRSIPLDLRDAFGGKTAWVKYLGRDSAKAEIAAHTEDAKYGELIHQWRQLSAAERVEMLNLGKQVSGADHTLALGASVTNDTDKSDWRVHLKPKRGRAAKRGPLDALLAYVENGEMKSDWWDLGPHERRSIEKAGGSKSYQRNADATDSGVPFVQAVANLPLPDDDDADAPDLVLPPDVDTAADDATAADAALLIVQAQRSVAKLKGGYTLARASVKRIVPSRANGGTSKLLALVDLWENVRRPRSPKARQKARLFMRRFIETVGDMTPRLVSRAHVIKFRDELEAKELSTSSVSAHLKALHVLFNTAMSEGAMDVNPAYQVRARKDTKKVSDRRQDFTSEQLRTILDKAKDEREDYHWIIRLLVYTGARSGEICQLRCDDVVTERGVSVFRIHDRHEGTRIKNRASERDVPLPPACHGLLDYAQRIASKHGADSWLFPRLKNSKQGRAHGFQNYVRVFLRGKCGITSREHTMHSARHAFRTMARELSMPEPISRAIMGHSQGSDDHGSYGKVPSLQLRAEWIAKIEP